MPDPSTAAFAPPSLFDLPLGDVATYAWLVCALLISSALGLFQASLELIPSSRVLALVPAGPRSERLAALLSAPAKVLVSASFLKLSFELTFLALLLPMVASDATIDLVALLSAIAISEEHTSDLQSLLNLVCRLLLEKNNKHKTNYTPAHTAKT